RLAREGLDSLAAEGKLGALLIQFPVSFKNASLNREYLELLLRQFIEYPRVVEVRHESWNQPETIAEFMRHNVGFCNIDQPLLGRSLAPTEHVTSGVGYVRLHGRNYEHWFDGGSDSDNRNRDDRYNYLYKPAELEKWKEKIDAISRRVNLRDREQSLSGEGRRECAGVKAPAGREKSPRSRDAGETLSRTESNG